MMSSLSRSTLLNVLALVGVGLVASSQAAFAVPKTPVVPGATPSVPEVPKSLPTIPGTNTPIPGTMPGMPEMPKGDMPKDDMPKPDDKKAKAPKQNIVEVAASNNSFKTLVKAVKAAGLVETLSGKGPFKVFAPTDAAFAALPKGTLEKLLRPENKAQLVKLLTYHVIPESASAAQLGNATQIKTVEGQELMITTKPDGMMISGAKVLIADVPASNGLIHAIDKVLLPPEAAKLSPETPQPTAAKPVKKVLPKKPQTIPSGSGL
jgi:uncharacterized surface protein with fasciclin (FAS1) repeats